MIVGVGGGIRLAAVLFGILTWDFGVRAPVDRMDGRIPDMSVGISGWVICGSVNAARMNDEREAQHLRRNEVFCFTVDLDVGCWSIFTRVR